MRMIGDQGEQAVHQDDYKSPTKVAKNAELPLMARETEPTPG